MSASFIKPHGDGAAKQAARRVAETESFFHSSQIYPSKMAVEAEDDVFFADLSRQIALLIMDDEEQLPVHMQYPPLPVQELPYMPQIMMPPTYGYDQVAYTREMSKGTGVFIPRSTTPRRKNKPRNKSSSVKNYSFPRQQQLEKSAVMVSHISNNTIGSCPNYYRRHL